MSEQTQRILFMDDEPTSDVVTNAVERLRAAGFVVDFVETMSEAIEAYYRQYYAVFVLDIDMSHQATDQDGDGVRVLKRFVSLHNQTRVILFSGAGTEQHWFQAANAHCYAYVHKLDNDPGTGEDSIDRLIRTVRAATDEPLYSGPLSTKAPPDRVLLVSGDLELVPPVRQSIHEALGPAWTIDEMDLSAAARVDSSAYGVIVIVQRIFSTRATVRDALASVLGSAPQPQTIVCCEGHDRCRPAILDIANRHPFRMLDLTSPQWLIQLQDALRDARLWYGQQEILQADPDALRRIHLMLPQDCIARWDENEWADLVASDSADATDQPTTRVTPS